MMSAVSTIQREELLTDEVSGKFPEVAMAAVIGSVQFDIDTGFYATAHRLARYEVKDQPISDFAKTSQAIEEMLRNRVNCFIENPPASRHGVESHIALASDNRRYRSPQNVSKKQLTAALDLLPEPNLASGHAIPCPGSQLEPRQPGSFVGALLGVTQIYPAEREIEA